MCYYFDDITNFQSFGFHNILTDEKSNESILIYNISYRTLIGARPLCIGVTGRTRYNFIMKLHNATRYLVLFGPEKCNIIYNWIRLKRLVFYIVFLISMQELKLIDMIVLSLKRHWRCKMLQYSLSQFLIRVKITTSIIYL